MNDTVIKNYAIWARRELIAEVIKRAAYFGILEKDSPASSADTIDGRVLTAQQRHQRADLLRIMKNTGYQELIERAAYTWFNRLLAIRFMEVNDRLPSHIRMLSAPDGLFKPQALAEAMDMPLEALDPSKAAELVQAGDDEALFRLVFLAQCDELASCMPAVFDKVGSAMELLLPDGLLKKGGVIEQLVTTIPEEDWKEGVEIVGWMYQYYVSERKDEVFASFKKGKKAERDAIAPATQLFTPNWIVRYLTENSLGRLWMLNHPDSLLAERMPYFVAPEEDAETEFKRVSSPEEITAVDPACGSGHILVYAFDLLAAMYAEAGYSNRDAARLILEKNLSGMEIDPRAGAMASFALTMKACELDSRFLRRDVRPRITVLERIVFEPEEKSQLACLRNKTDLLDAVAHLDECGSLLMVTADDLDAIARDCASLAGSEDIFVGSAAEKLEEMQEALAPLSAHYDVVVANPPYMGAKNMNNWLSRWVKENYPDVKGDLFSCFMVRNLEMGSQHAQLGFMTPYVWMFIGTYEKLRKIVTGQNTITSLIQLEYSGFAGATVPICTFTLQKGYLEGYKGGYVRLSDFVGADQQAPRALEALANPDCGWFFRRSTDDFSVVPGSPIAYWMSDRALSCFQKGTPIGNLAAPRKGNSTSNNDRFLRRWFEVSASHMSIGANRIVAEETKRARWYPYNKGGDYRRWYGNNDYLVDWYDNGSLIRAIPTSVVTNEQYYMQPGLTWSTVSSAKFNIRKFNEGFIFDNGGCCIFELAENANYVLGLMNSRGVSRTLCK